MTRVGGAEGMLVIWRDAKREFHYDATLGNVCRSALWRLFQSNTGRKKQGFHNSPHPLAPCQRKTHTLKMTQDGKLSSESFWTGTSAVSNFPFSWAVQLPSFQITHSTFFFSWNLFLLSLFFCPASVGLIRRLAGPPSYCRLLRTPLSDSELWAPPSSLALVLKGFLLLEWVNMFSDTQPDEESRLGSWTAVDAVRRLPPIFKFPFCFQFSPAVDLHGVVLCCARTTLARH